MRPAHSCSLRGAARAPRIASLPGANLSTLCEGLAGPVVSMASSDRAAYGRTLVIPMYREAPRIARTVRTLAASALNDPGTEIILVDDGSDDDTAGVARTALGAASLTASILRLERNLGKGGAVRAGVLASGGRAVAFSDADLSVGVSDIVQCFAPIEGGRADVVCSSRAIAGSVI